MLCISLAYITQHRVEFEYVQCNGCSTQYVYVVNENNIIHVNCISELFECVSDFHEMDFCLSSDMCFGNDIVRILPKFHSVDTTLVQFRNWDAYPCCDLSTNLCTVYHRKSAVAIVQYNVLFGN